MKEETIRIADKKMWAPGAVLAAAAVMMMLLISACASEEDTAFRENGLATGEPGMNKYLRKPPGEESVVERPYPGAPPVVPHATAGMAITREKNDCAGCHKAGVKLEKDTATMIPESHYEEGELAGIRYNCLQCHVPQAEGEPPVQAGSSELAL